MNNQDYESKKRECWEDFCDEHLFDPHNIVTQGIFGYAFDRAYALGRQEKDSDTVIQGWVARDLGGGLYTYCYEPQRNLMKGIWEEEIVNMPMPNDMFPDLTWESDPEPVEIIIKRKKK